MAVDRRWEGVDEYLSALTEAQVQGTRELKDIVDDSTRYGHDVMKIYAPVGTQFRQATQDGPTLASRLRRDRARADAGGAIEGRAGVTAGDKYPLYVHQGTGLYRLDGRGSRITSREQGRPMTFQKKGEPRRFRMSARGQEPQPFVYGAFLAVKTYLRGRLARFDLGRLRRADR